MSDYDSDDDTDSVLAAELPHLEVTHGLQEQDEPPFPDIVPLAPFAPPAFHTAFNVIKDYDIDDS